jgi:hypothetical protein
MKIEANPLHTTIHDIKPDEIDNPEPDGDNEETDKIDAELPKGDAPPIYLERRIRQEPSPRGNRSRIEPDSLKHPSKSIDFK